MNNTTLTQQIENALRARDEALVQVETEIAGCENRISELKQLRDRLTGRTSTVMKQTKHTKLVDRIIAVMTPAITNHPDKCLDIATMSKLVYTHLGGDVTEGSVYTYINQLIKTGRFSRPARGMIALAPITTV